ncbi:hypothetical protein [Lysobacter sp. CA199]|uniref:hypothetical protein n=1 Tax=Lysobacter sp. CA199 TaxID=3455608 RepID=UPI003F8D214F
MQNEEPDDIDLARLKACLRGIRQTNDASFSELIALEEWREVAMVELQRRAAHALRLFPSDLLEKMAFDMVDTRRAMVEVFAESGPDAR